MNELIANIAGALKRNNIPYMVIGGQAALMYGEPRFTKDIDITLGVNVDRLKDLISISNKLNLKILPGNIEEFVSKTMVLPLIDEITGLRVVLIFSLTDFKTEAIKRCKVFDVNNVPVNYASIEDIIILKIFAGRERDIEDVNAIILKHPAFDKVYVMNWLKKFDGNEELYSSKFTEILNKLNK
ncbi:MAG: hypothetical protein EHM58_11440 [Ignavibacteriae bacterium]|nr:MAG: hypothetical protein EHM58_11440 [Ignavibacteriota bacterium]